MKNTNQLLINFSIAFYLAMGFGILDVHFAKAQKQKLTPAPPTSMTSSAGQAFESGTQGGLVKKEEEKTIEDTTPKRTPPQNASSEATGTKKTQREEIEDYIREKFGKDADKAFLLLKGKGEGTCAENRTLDQNQVNDNTWWGGKGRDWGIFQISDYYHPVFELNLHKDWKANVDYAYKMFVNDGRTFKRWTCGKAYKI